MASSTSPTQSADEDPKWVSLKSRLDQLIKDQKRLSISPYDVDLAIAKKAVSYLVDIYRRQDQQLEDQCKAHGIYRPDIDQNGLLRPQDIENLKDEEAREMTTAMVEDLIFLAQEKEEVARGIQYLSRQAGEATE